MMPPPLFPPNALLSQLQLLQTQNQLRLQQLVGNQLTFAEHGQINPQFTEELSKLAIATGLNSCSARMNYLG